MIISVLYWEQWDELTGEGWHCVVLDPYLGLIADGWGESDILAIKNTQSNIELEQEYTQCIAG